MEKLAEWLKQFQKPLLVSHNGHTFDSIILSKKCLKSPCFLAFEGFVDSLFLRKSFQVEKVTCWKRLKTARK